MIVAIGKLFGEGLSEPVVELADTGYLAGVAVVVIIDERPYHHRHGYTGMDEIVCINVLNLDLGVLQVDVDGVVELEHFIVEPLTGTFFVIQRERILPFGV